MKNILLILLSLGLTGCVTISKAKSLEREILQLKESTQNKDMEIQRLQDLLKEKDVKIKELRKKLESLGVF